MAMQKKASIAAVVGATFVTLSAAAAWAQTATGEKMQVTVPANALNAGDIQTRLAAQGIKVKEIEIKDLLAEVEGFDAQGREVDLVLDRRTGETLSHQYDR